MLPIKGTYHRFPRLYRSGTFKLYLCLSCTFLFLLPNVCLDDFLVDFHREDKITFCPYAFFVPVDLLHEDEFLFQCSTGIGFYDFYGFAHRILGRDQHIQMSVINVYANLQIFPIRIMLSDL